MRIEINALPKQIANEDNPVYPQLTKETFFDILQASLVTGWGLNNGLRITGNIRSVFLNEADHLREEMRTAAQLYHSRLMRNEVAVGFGAQSWDHLTLICDDFREFAFHRAGTVLCGMGRGDRYVQVRMHNKSARFYVVDKLTAMIETSKNGSASAQPRPII